MGVLREDRDKGQISSQHVWTEKLLGNSLAPKQNAGIGPEPGLGQGQVWATDTKNPLSEVRQPCRSPTTRAHLRSLDWKLCADIHHKFRTLNYQHHLLTVTIIAMATAIAGLLSFYRDMESSQISPRATTTAGHRPLHGWVTGWGPENTPLLSLPPGRISTLGCIGKGHCCVSSPFKR